MSVHTPTDWLARYRPARKTVLVLVAVCGLEAVSLLAYLRVFPGFFTQPRYLAYPFVWLNAAGLAVLRVDRPAASRRGAAVAGTLAVGYFLVLTIVDGTIALAPATGVDVYWRLPPGWGPMVVADAGPFRIAAVPFRLLGYAALSYLLYVTFRDASRRALGGVVGLFSCVSCTLPVVAAAVSGLVGGTGLAATAWSYDLSTVVFLVTVGILAWRPGG